MDSNERKIVQELVTVLGCVIPASDGYEPRTNLWNKYMAAKNMLAAAPQVVADERKGSPYPDYDRGFSNGWDACAKRAAAPVQAQEPVAAAISYWKGPTNSNGTPRECGDANIGRWLDYEPTTLKHGMAIKDRGDPDKRVKFLFDAAPVQPLAVPDGKYGRLTGDNIAQPVQMKVETK